MSNCRTLHRRQRRPSGWAVEPWRHFARSTVPAIAWLALTFGGTREALAQAAPRIDSVTPNLIAPQAEVELTIRGSGFSATHGFRVAVGRVGMNLTNVRIVSATEGRGTTPKLPAGTFELQLINVRTGGLVTSLPRALEVAAPATITSVSPTQISTEGGAAVTIRGTGFRAVTRVRFGTAEIAGATPSGDGTTITGTAPANAEGTYDVTVEDSRGSAVLRRAVTYVAPPPRVSITDIAPRLVSTAGGTALVIKGTGFQAGDGVGIGPGSLTIVSIAPGEIRGTTPSLPQGAHIVTIVRKGAVVARDADGVVAALPPDAISVNPDRIAVGMQPRVAVSGRGFRAGTTAKIGGALLTAIAIAPNGTSLQGDAPDLAAGVYDVVVENELGSDTLPRAVTYFEDPNVSITSIAPRLVSSDGGTAITIRGTGFVAGDVVRVGSVDIANPQLGRNALIATVPKIAPGFYPVHVVRGGEVKATDEEGVEAAPPPEVFSFDPEEVCSEGGTVLRMLGANLRAETTLMIGNVAILDILADDVNGSTICADIPAVPEGNHTVRIVDPRASFDTPFRIQSVGACTTEPGPVQVETSRAEGTARFRWHNPIDYAEIVIEDTDGNEVATLPGDATEFEIPVESADPFELVIRGSIESQGELKVTKGIAAIAKFLDCDRPPPLNFVGKAGELDMSLRGDYPPPAVSRCGFDPDPIDGDNDPPSIYSGVGPYQLVGSIGLAKPQVLLPVGDFATGTDRLTTGFILEEDATALEIAAYYEKIATDAGVQLRCRIRRVFPEDDKRFSDEFTFPDIIIGKGKQWNCTTYFRAESDLIDPNADRCMDPNGPNGFKAIPAGEYLLDFYTVGGDPKTPYFVFADDAYDHELLIPGAPCGPYPLVTVRDLTGQQTLPVISEVLAKVLIDAVLEPDHPHQKPWVRFQAIGTWLDEEGNVHKVGVEPDNPDFEYIWTVYDRMGENGRTQSSGSSSRHEMEVEDYGCYYIDLEVRDKRCPMSKKRSYQVVIIRCPINLCVNDGRPYQFLYPTPEPGGLYAIAGLNPEPGTGTFAGERPVEFRVVVAPTCSCGTEPCNALTYQGCAAAQLDDLEFRIAAKFYSLNGPPEWKALTIPGGFIQVTDECLDVEFGPKYFHVFIDDLGRIPSIPYPFLGDRHVFRDVKLQAKGVNEPGSAWHDIGLPFHMGNYPAALDNGIWTGHFEQDGFFPADQTYHFVVKTTQGTEKNVNAGSSEPIDLLGVAEVPSYPNNLSSGFISRFQMSKGVYGPEEGQGTSSGNIMGNGMDGAPVRVGGADTSADMQALLAQGDGGAHILDDLEAPRYEWCDHQDIFHNEFSQKLFESILYTGTIGPVPVTIWASIGIGFWVDIQSQITVFVSPFAPLEGGPFVESHFYLLSELGIRIPCEVRADILGGIGSIAVRLIPSATFFFDTHVFTFDASPNAAFFYDCLFDLAMEVEGCINLLLAEVCVGVTIPIVEDAHLIGPNGDSPRPPITCDDDGGGNEIVNRMLAGPDGGAFNHDHSQAFSFYMKTSAPVTVTSPDGQTTIDMWIDEHGLGKFFVNESDPTEFPEFFFGGEYRGQYRDPAAAFLSNTSALLAWSESFAQDLGLSVEELHDPQSLTMPEQNLFTRQDEIVISALVYEKNGPFFEWVPHEVFRIADDPNEVTDPTMRSPDGRVSMAADLSDESAWLAWVRYDGDFLVLDGTKTIREPCTPQDICVCVATPQVPKPRCFKTVTVPNWRPQLETTGIWVRRCAVEGGLDPKQKISNPGINIEPSIAVSPSGDTAYCVWVHDSSVDPNTQLPHVNLVDSNLGRELVFSRYDKATGTWSPQAQVVVGPDRFPGILEPSVALKDDLTGLVAFTALDESAPKRDTGLGAGNRSVYVVHLDNGVFGEPIRIHGKCFKREYGHWAHVVVDIPAEINFSDLYHGPHPEWVMIFEGKGPAGTRAGSGDVMVSVLGQGMNDWTAPMSLTPEDTIVSNIAGSLRGGVLGTVHLDQGPALLADGVAQGLPEEPSFVKVKTSLEPDLAIAACRLSDGFPAPGSLITATVDVENRGLAGSAIVTATGESACGVEILYITARGEERVVASTALPVIQPGEVHQVELGIEMPHDPVQLVARVSPNPVDRDPANDYNICFFGAPPVELLQCGITIALSESTPLVARLQWENPAIYDEIMIYKDGSMLTSLSGLATSYIDLYVERGETYHYEVRGRVGVSKSIRRGCDLTIEPAPEPDGRFRRADTNGDGKVDISDPIATLHWLFLGGAEPPCISAADSNDSGKVDISDPTYTLNYLFLGGAHPPAPEGACGRDPTPDELTCLRSHNCE